MEYPTIPLIGPPGAGKTTAGKRLAAEFPHYFFYVSTGDMVRAAMAEDSDLGRKLIEFTQRGELTPDDVIRDMLVQYIDSMVRSNAFQPAYQFLLLDGSPRTVEQVDLFKDVLDVREVYFCDLALDDAKSRLLSRRLEDVADGKAPRDDDNDEAIERRLADYVQITFPVICAYIRASIPTIIFDMSGSKDQVFDRMRDHALDYTVFLLDHHE